jgi:hypothetical protein
LLHRCSIDVPYLLRYETYTGHIWDIYGTSSALPALWVHFTRASGGAITNEG